VGRREREAPELAGAARRMLLALARRAGQGELEALESLRDLRNESEAFLEMGVHLYRASPALSSWAEIGRLLGITRQAAQQRFGGDQ
jgi:hypothetical protein